MKELIYKIRLKLWEKRRQAMLSKLPGRPTVIINTLPKSGSMFIAKTLGQCLHSDLEYISNSYFPEDVVDVVKLRKVMAEGNTISQNHFPAYRINIQLLEKYCDRMVLHLRDPRQAMLSWVHHMNKCYKAEAYDELDTYCPAPGKEYFEKSLEEQISINIETHLTVSVNWIERWLEALENMKSMKVMVTTYEEFVVDNRPFFEKLLDFYGISQNDFKPPDLELSDRTHYRKGKTDEWKEVFSEEQKKRSDEIMPQKLKERFNWSS